MEEDDYLFLGVAAVAGYFITKGIFKLPDTLGKVADVAYVDAYNTAAGFSNQLGITNTQAGTNSMGSGISVMTASPFVAPAPIANYNTVAGFTNNLGITNTQAGANAWGEGTSIMTGQNDLIKGWHLW